MWNENNNATGKIHFISTGHSNAFLLESNGHYGLIDASEAVYQKPIDLNDVTKCMSDATCKKDNNVTKVANYLRQIGVTQLDFVLTSHSHDDHIGGMPLIAQNFVNSNTKYYYRTYVTTGDDTNHVDWYNRDYFNRAVNSMRNAGATLIEVTNKKPTFTLGDFTIKLLNTEPASENELENGVAINENYNSIVALVSIGNKKTLITGDMTSTDEIKVAGETGTIDILQMPHHGGLSYTSNSFLNAIKPHDVIIPASGLRTDQQIKALYKAMTTYGTNFYVTGTATQSNDAIITSFQNNLYTVKNSNNSTASPVTLNYSLYSQSGRWIYFQDKSDVVWAHVKSDNSLDTGWKELEYNNKTSWFYFFGGGAMATDWQKLTVNGTTSWYYFGDGGRMVTGWHELTYNKITSWYYFFEDGRMATGWQKISYRGQEQWFYLGNDGRMVTGIQSIGNQQYTFNNNGVCIQGSGCPLNPL